MWSHLKDKGVELPSISAEEISRQVEPVLRVMEKNGIKIDLDVFSALEKRLEKRVSELEKNIFDSAEGEFNISSPIQIQQILFEKLKLPTLELKQTKNGVSTAASELKKIEREHGIIPLILEYRELSKLLSTYLKPLPKMVDKNNRLHTTYGQDTGTGRITSCNPNLQNIPIRGEYGPEIRSAFVPEKGNKLIIADYSQIELRVVASLSGDEVMMEAFEKSEDIHSKTASELFDIDIKEVNKAHRGLAKTVNFGVLYGMSPYGLSQALNIDQKAATEYIDKYFSVHTGIRKYVNTMIETAEQDGVVETLFGFKRELKNIRSNNYAVREAERRIAINTPVQGTAAEILKLAMIELYSQLNDKFLISNDESNVKFQKLNSRKLAASSYKLKANEAKLLLTVHDELVVEAPEEEAQNVAKVMKEVMENVVKLSVPIEVEVGIGDNWEEAK